MKEIFEEDEIKGEFKSVPIERSKNNDIEIYNIYTSPSSSANKLRKKICKYISIFLLICVFIIFTKKMLLDGILQILNIDFDDIEENEYNYNKRNNNFDEENIEYNEGEKFYLAQNSSNIDMDSLSSPQLKNPENIKLINNLEITLDVEYDKFVHLKIKDADNKRWEIPKREILNKKYLYSLSDNRVPLSIYSNYLEAKNFFVQFLTNKFNEEDFELKQEMHSNNDDFENIEEFSFRLMNINEEEIFSFNSSSNFIFSENYINFQYQLTSDDIYGFNEKNPYFKLSEGLYTIWPQDHIGANYGIKGGSTPSYGHHPIAIHRTMYENIWMGFVFLNSNAQDVKISKLNDNDVNLEHKTIGGIIDYYIAVDESPEEVLKDLRFLLGIPTLPPFWSLGFHQSGNGYKDFEEFKNVYEKYKNFEIPIDTMWVDNSAIDNFEIFTLNDKFKQLGSYVENEIHKDGGKFIPIIDLGLSIENQNSSLVKLGNSLDIFIKSNDTKETLISKISSGKTVFPDFMNLKISEFWNTCLNNLQTQVNFDGICLDLNEPSIDTKNNNNDNNIDNLSYIPGYNPNQNKEEYILSKSSLNENAILIGNLSVYDAKPLLSYYQGKISYEYLNKNLKKRPFILSRSTTFGSGKHVFHLLDENHKEESNIKESISGIFNFDIFGIPFTGGDICQNIKDTNKDLCLRAYGVGAFYPFIRNYKYPWSFDNSPGTSNNNETKDINENNMVKIIKDVINCRYSILRYMYSQLFLISLNEKGSFFKPVMFVYPEDQSSYEDIESKIMLGDALLLCVFNDVNEMSKEFTLPDSGFNRYPNGKRIINKNDENRKISLSGKLDEINIFLREGFIIPKQNTFEKYIMNTNKLREENLDLIININDLKQSSGVIFFDNDDINTIIGKRYCRVDLNFTENKLIINSQKNNLKKYNYTDDILGNIELWNANKVFNDINKNMKFDIEIVCIKGNKMIEGKFDEENNKITFNINEKEKYISIFDVKTILFNSK